MAAIPDTDNPGHTNAPARSAETRHGFLGTWLYAQCASLTGVRRGVVVGAKDPASPVAVWPEGAEITAGMLDAARLTLDGKGGIVALGPVPQDGERVAAPVSRAGGILGAMVLDVVGLTDEARATFRARIASNAPQASHLAGAGAVNARGLTVVVDLLAGCVDLRRFNDAGGALCNELAARLGLVRVSLGASDGGKTRLVAMSHSAVIDTRSNLSRDIASAMSEAVDQGRTIVWPASSHDTADAGPTPAHETLARRHGAGHVLSLPMICDGALVGAITMERDQAMPFDAGTIGVVESLALVAGPLLELRRRDERSPWRHAADSAGELLTKLVGRSHARAKILATAGAVLVAWAAMTQAPLRVTAPARLEGHTQRVVVAPLDGFIAEAGARAGDTVSAGDVIARLEDRELALEMSRWSGELDQLRKQYRGALAAHDRAQTSILTARIGRTEAQVALLASQIERTQLRAPIDGIVIAGDLSQLLGSPVARGDVLFEVAPLSGYRVVIDVDERDIGFVTENLTGHVALEGLAGVTLPIVVEKVTPVSTQRDGRNFFRVEARVDAPVDPLRPGMAGYAKIVAGERSRLWIWTHGAIEWLRLKTWVLWP